MTQARIVKSTTDLSPRGLAGYSKGMSSAVAALGAVLAAIVPYLEPGSDWARWLGIAIAILGAIGTVVIPNQVEPVLVVPPTSGTAAAAVGTVPPPDAPVG